MKSRTASNLILLLATGVLAGPVHGQEVEQFYAGKSITMAVPSGPGGGYDTYARTLARHYSNHIPGHPQIVVQNVPAGGGMVAANNTFNISPKDGTALALLASSSLLVGALGEPQARFNNLKFTLIGNLSEESDTCAVWHTAGVKDTQDFLSREMMIGGEGSGSNSQTFPVVMNEVLGAKLKVISGYSGTQLRAAAMERGELQGACGIFVSTMNAIFQRQLKEGTIRVILQMGLSRNPMYPDVPNALELAKDAEGRAVLTLMFAQLALGRPVVGPPDMPKARAEALVKAFAETMVDPEYLADAALMKLDNRWFGPARMEEVLRQIDAADEPTKARVRKILNIEAKPAK